ncbi:hypothetical protein H5J46_004532 [Escherichia coli]|nr:hypothetical protein [Escherichia coli]QPJ24806.1 hypothetical protein H7994_02415 [Escherichia coli O150:H6]EFE9644601.1 hypothetical protein [Escherichia coli]EFH3711496.1 hypothetical protein [Escherichia coli]EFH5787124.1 hypothetical protein [Escherichia coli]
MVHNGAGARDTARTLKTASRHSFAL